MRLPADPSNGNEAVAWAVVAALRLFGWLLFAGGTTAAIVPDRMLFAFRLIRNGIPPRARRCMRVAFHAAALVLLHACNALHVHALAVLLLWRWPEPTRAFFCVHEPLRTIFADPDVVRTLSCAVCVVYAAQFVDRAALLLLGAPPMGVRERLARAFHAGVLWVATMDASPLAPLLGVLIGVDLELAHLAELLEHVRPRYASWADWARWACGHVLGVGACIAATRVRECELSDPRATRRSCAGATLVGAMHAAPLIARTIAAVVRFGSLPSSPRRQ